MAGETTPQRRTNDYRPMAEDGTTIRVKCKDCSFERVVDADADPRPADVVIQHGERTGHTLAVSRIEDDA